MTRTLLFCFLSLFAFTANMNAQSDIVGRYNGELTVEFDGSTMNADIYVTFDNGTQTYALSVKGFMFGTEEIGDLEISEITREDSGNVAELKKEGPSEGPTPPSIGIPTIIYLDYATIFDGALDLELTVKTPSGADSEMTLTEVSFEGTLQVINSLSNTFESSLSICSSNDIIAIEGVNNENYTIYAINGTTIQTGKVQNSKIEIDSIPTGVYILNVNNKTVKFTK